MYHIPNTDLTISRMAYGCAMLGITTPTGDWTGKDIRDFVAQTVPLIELAYSQGINFLDLAESYGNGNAEVAVGEVIKGHPELREKMVIQSKCGLKDGVIDSSGSRIVAATEGSLKRLRIETLDILLLHMPDSLVEPDEVASAFDRLHAGGKVRYFGVSNHGPAQIDILKKSVRQPLVVNQIYLGLGNWDQPLRVDLSRLTHGANAAATVDYCQLNDIQVQAYSPLRVSTPSGANLLRPEENAIPAVKQAAKTLAEIADRHDATPAAVMLAWLLRHPAKIVPILGATKREHLIDSCTADRIDLTREEWYALLNSTASMQSAHAG